MRFGVGFHAFALHRRFRCSFCTVSNMFKMIKCKDSVWKGGFLVPEMSKRPFSHISNMSLNGNNNPWVTWSHTSAAHSADNYVWIKAKMLKYWGRRRHFTPALGKANKQTNKHKHTTHSKWFFFYHIHNLPVWRCCVSEFRVRQPRTTSWYNKGPLNASRAAVLFTGIQSGYRRDEQLPRELERLQHEEMWATTEHLKLFLEKNKTKQMAEN